MKKFILTGAVLAMICACGNSTQQKGNQNDEVKDSLVDVINQKEAELDSFMNTFNEIQEGFSQINEAQGRINLDKGNIEKTSSVNSIKENMKYIEETMDHNKQLINELQKKLKSSSSQSAQLQKILDKLTNEMKEKEEAIKQLQAELEQKNVVIEEQNKTISNLNTNVGQLEDANRQKAQKVAEQDQQINSAWFVFGTKSELSDQKILSKGEVLKNENFNRDYFTKIDIRVDKEIKLYSKSAKLLTNHPANSYTLTKDENGKYVLRITNPSAFWAASKYLVVLVK